MNTSHPVTPFNCGCPLRDHTPSPAIHPELSKVNIDGSLISGMIAPINGDAQNEDVYNRKSFLKLNKLIESTPAASPAAGGASDGGDS